MNRGVHVQYNASGGAAFSKEFFMDYTRNSRYYECSRGKYAQGFGQPDKIRKCFGGTEGIGRHDGANTK
jgi:hypothetical protein